MHVPIIATEKIITIGLNLNFRNKNNERKNKIASIGLKLFMLRLPILFVLKNANKTIEMAALAIRETTAGLNSARIFFTVFKF